MMRLAKSIEEPIGTPMFLAECLIPDRTLNATNDLMLERTRNKLQLVCSGKSSYVFA